MAAHLFSLQRPSMGWGDRLSPGSLRLVTGAVRTFRAPLLHAIVVLEGRVWITAEGDPEDHVLHAGDAFVPRVPGNVVLEALTPTRVEIDHG